MLHSTMLRIVAAIDKASEIGNMKKSELFYEVASVFRMVSDNMWPDEKITRTDLYYASLQLSNIAKKCCIEEHVDEIKNNIANSFDFFHRMDSKKK